MKAQKRQNFQRDQRRMQQEHVLRERIERERIERERLAEIEAKARRHRVEAWAREQQRLERERLTRERLERERLERERLERERLMRERLEREQREQRERLERERLAEAACTEAAGIKTTQNAGTPQCQLDPWMLYETAWKTLASPHGSGPLRLGDIPWPIQRPPGYPHGQKLPLSFLTLRNIRSFLLDPYHFAGKSTRVRVREALLIWHPDKFESRIKAKVTPSEWVHVFAGCEAVIRVLTSSEFTQE
jgi:hypothetical protein